MQMRVPQNYRAQATENLDYTYLAEWAEHLYITDTLTQAYSEAGLSE